MQWKIYTERRFFIESMKNGFQFASNSSSLSKVIKAIRKESGLKIGIPKARQTEKITLCVQNRSMTSLLKSMLKTNYIITFNNNNISDVIVVQESTEENTKFSILSTFSGKIVVRGNVANIFYVPATEDKDDIEHYISSRHLILDELNENYPNTDFDAQISFKKAISKDQLLEIFEDYDVTVSDLNTINGEYTGGNEVAEGMTLRKAVDTADAVEMEFLNVHCVEEKTELDNTSTLDECKKLNESYNNRGIMFYGAMVKAKPKKLRAVRDESNHIRLIDPMWSGGVSDELSREYKVKHTAIPLIPETR